MFNGSHYHLIRVSPIYRLQCQLEDMRLEMEPAWAQPREPEPETKTSIKYEISLDRKAMELQNRIVALENIIKSLTDKKSKKYIL